MTHMTIGEFKQRFSSVLEKVRKGQKIVISYGRKREKVAIIGPYPRGKTASQRRRLGVLGKRASFEMRDFSMTDEELLNS